MEKNLWDKLSALSGEVTNVTEMLKAYIVLIEPSLKGETSIDDDMIANGICGIIGYLERISNDLDKLSLSNPTE